MDEAEVGGAGGGGVGGGSGTAAQVEVELGESAKSRVWEMFLGMAGSRGTVVIGDTDPAPLLQRRPPGTTAAAAMTIA